MKTLNDLTVIAEEPIAQGLNETRFMKKYDKCPIPSEKIEILQQSPVLLLEMYGDLFMLQRNIIPEEANAILLGQEGLFPGSVERKIYSASYCNIKK